MNILQLKVTEEPREAEKRAKCYAAWKGLVSSTRSWPQVWARRLLVWPTGPCWDSVAMVCGRETECKGLLSQSKALVGKLCCLSKMYLLKIKIKQLVMQSLFKQTPHAQIFKRVLLFIFPLSSGLFAWVKTARFGPMEHDLNKLQEVNGKKILYCSLIAWIAWTAFR